ncbi:hypothetical protein ACN47E_003184 [Coniothyrium glycines]
MAAMEELGIQLQSLQALKPPGITPTKIKAITQICVDNIQSETVILQSIVQQFQKSAATHKLGVLYVVDAVARQWVEKAKSAGQAVTKHAAPGTYASGVQLVRDVLPVLLGNLVNSAPEAQKEKISKLLDIWERGQTFPHEMLVSFKQLLKGGQNVATQPPAGPPRTNVAGQNFIAQTNQLPIAPSPQAPESSAPPAITSAFPFAQNSAPPPPPGFVPPLPPSANVHAALPPPPAGVHDVAGQIIQAMSAGSIAPNQAITILNALAAAQNGGLPLPPLQSAAGVQPLPQVQNSLQNGGQPDRYDPNDSSMRARSRSPDYHRNGSPAHRSPPNMNRRNSPTYGVYDPNAGPDGNAQSDRGDRSRGRGKQRGAKNEYRQRSPPRRQPSPPRNVYGQSKFIDWDDSLPRDHIRVLSRTLFVGGAGGTEGEIRSIFSRFGRVQTCIVNQDKRHAFVKMMTRPDSVAAKDGMDSLNDPVAQSKARQTRWGVGFGPRDCSDYQTGISVIPISRLTDADRKWALNAEHGGTGGCPLEGGMVIEEPDIEIGAGVSSKAISRRVPTDVPRGGRGGSFAGRGKIGGQGGGGNNNNGTNNGFDNAQPKFRKLERPVNDPRHISPRAEQGIAVPPAVPGFGFQLPGF